MSFSMLSRTTLELELGSNAHATLTVEIKIAAFYKEHQILIHLLLYANDSAAVVSSIHSN